MKPKVQRIKRYLNPIAQLHYIAEQPYKFLIAGRGFSKSFGNGASQAKKLQLMPRSLGLFTSPTYSMIYSKTLIPMKAALEQHFGYIEGIHYVVGKVPPKHFAKPYHRPHRYENVITFWNGRSVVFGSFDRPSLMSGGSYDDVDNDECYLFDKSDYDNYVIPTLRGTHPSFRDCVIHLQQSFTSSMPFKNQGEWLLDNYPKAKTNPRMYSFLGWEPNAKVQLGSTWMNRYVLGAKAILQMKAEMEELAYLVMIMNQHITNFGNTFYPALAARHFYIPKANDKLINVPIGSFGNLKRDATYDEGPDDYNPDMPLNISHDWGKFNSITIDQEYPKEVRFINEMFTLNAGTDPKDQNDLADNFCEYYRMHRRKIVYQWGDRTGNNRVANSKNTYFQEFAARLRKNGWIVVMKKTGDVEHLERHRFITILHKGEDTRLPKVRHNATNCANLKISLEGAPMIGDKKDKSSETNPKIKPQHATHLSDCYDNRLYHGFKERERGLITLGAYTTSLNGD